MTWKNASPRKCTHIWEIFEKISKYAGIPLPDSKTLEEFTNASLLEILEFGQLVLNDEKLWSKIPETFSVSDELSVNREELRNELKEVLYDSR